MNFSSGISTTTLSISTLTTMTTTLIFPSARAYRGIDYASWEYCRIHGVVGLYLLQAQILVIWIPILLSSSLQWRSHLFKEYTIISCIKLVLFWFCSSFWTCEICVDSSVGRKLLLQTYTPLLFCSDPSNNCMSIGQLWLVIPLLSHVARRGVQLHTVLLFFPTFCGYWRWVLMNRKPSPRRRWPFVFTLIQGGTHTVALICSRFWTPLLSLCVAEGPIYPLPGSSHILFHYDIRS